MTFLQAQVLGFIRAQIEQTGVCPSYDEIAIQFGISSKSGTHRIVTDLIGRGLLRREGGRKRNLVPIEPKTAVSAVIIADDISSRYFGPDTTTTLRDVALAVLAKHGIR